MKAFPAGPPMAPCTLSCGWLSKMPSRLWSLWLDAFALANPAASVPLSLPAKFAVRNALLMVGSETVPCVVRSRSGLTRLRPRAAGCSKNMPAGAAATALQKSAVLLRPRCASTSFCS